MSIILDQISKRYANQHVVDQVSLEIADGELFVLLGSSGSGKSTILRLIAGLTEPTSGRILLHGRDVTGLSPQERGIGFVFQNYSIFRHMTVAENIEFGLKIRKISAAERKRRSEALLDMVGLVGLGKRYAHQLSGGQQQRVALARALVYEPNVLLLDEPFGALDVKIRSQLRRNLKEVQRKLGVTTILVTHDQEEAFELADRIGVLERGRLLESGEGEQLYSRPQSLFTATFLGAGTILAGRARDGQARFGPLSLPIPKEVPHEEGAHVQVLFRPEHITLSETEPPPGDATLGKGKIVEQNFAGPLRRVRLRMPRPERTRQIAPPLPFGEQGLLVDAYLPAELSPGGDEVWASLHNWTILRQAPPRFLVCDSGEGPTALLSLAGLLAERLGASTTILAIAKGVESVEPLRTRLAQRQREAGLHQAELRVRQGDKREQILAEQSEYLYDLIVLTEKIKPLRIAGKEPSARRVGATLVKLLEDADTPVLAAKGEQTRLERVLICTAAGEPGKGDVRMGGGLARALGAHATLLYVMKDSEEPGALTRSHLERAATTLHSLDVVTDVKYRQAASASAGILQEAGAGNYDLIVIGSHGPRSRFFSRVDDVALKVLSGADCSVLVVPAGWRD